MSPSTKRLLKVAKLIQAQRNGDPFKDKIKDLYRHLAGLEERFIEARDATDDPIKRVILTGMWADWQNFKDDKWKSSFYALEHDDYESLSA
jgi:hypothetical protein